MKKNFVKQIFIITFLAFLVGCSNSPKLKVNFLSKDKIEIVNNGKKEVTSLRVDVGRFYKDIDSIAPGEKLCFTTKDFIEYQTGKPYHSKGFNSNIGVYIKTENNTYKNIVTEYYKPICEDPAGLYFESDTFFHLKFYKYSNIGKYKCYSVTGSGLLSSDGGSVLSDGKYVFDKENNKLTLTTSGNIIWEGIYDGYSLELKRITEVKNMWAPSSLTLYPRYGSEKEENLLNDEKIADYESLFLLGLVQNYSENEAVIEYAKVYHSEEYTKYKNDEFVWHDLYSSIKKEYLDKIKNLGNKFSMRFNWHFGDYDFEKESFAIEFVEKNPVTKSSKNLSVTECRVYNEVEDNKSLGLAHLEDKYSTLNVTVPLQMQGRGIANMMVTKSIKFDIPMPKAEAQKFLESRKDASGKYDKSVFVIVYYEIPKYNPNSQLQNSIESLTKGIINYNNTINGNFYKIMVYDSRENMKKLRSAELK